MKKIVLGCFALVLVATGCLKGNSKMNCEFDECALKAPASEIQGIQDFLTSSNQTATQHCSGVFYTITNPGTGAAPAICNGVAVTYIGKLTNGNKFDESTSPVAFNLSGLIRGWQIGIPLIKKGGSIRLYIPPSFGYGNQSAGSIPPNSILIFDINLIDVY
jgi:FKBP-type peptidyl-prolyl cis-trans isomerase FkpA